MHYSRSSDADLASDRRPYKKVCLRTPSAPGSTLTRCLQRIEHAGYRRYILQRNPPKFDFDGDIIEPGDEEEEDDDLSTVEENPYADIRLEGTQILRP